MYFSQILKWFHAPPRSSEKLLGESICGEKDFLRILARERARAERSNHGFSLVVFDIEATEKNNNGLYQLLRELSSRLRLTDETGWLPNHGVGVILHNANAPNARTFAKNIRATLLLHNIQLTFKVYSYPTQSEAGSGVEKWRGRGGRTAGNRQGGKQEVEVDQTQLLYARQIPFGKRCLDLFGSTLGLVILSPVFLLLWVLIKVVSPGPAFYRQTRIGLGGRPFTLLKFRTMKVNADTTGHREYLHSLINGEKSPEGGCQAMAKLDDKDDNIIPMGKLVRKTYLDELPQLINVLLGDMSLIGPRPPIPYEVEEYQLWHTDRLDTTPGMTGLWQVSGKNRLSFDQMVRLDIRYCRKQSCWLDLKILLKTPLAIASEFSEKLGGLRQLLPYRHHRDKVHGDRRIGRSTHPPVAGASWLHKP